MNWNIDEEVFDGNIEDTDHTGDKIDELVVSIKELVLKKRNLEKNNVVLKKHVCDLKRELHEMKTKTTHDKDTIFMLCLANFFLFMVVRFYL
jgi:hypothetical protein